MYIFITLAVLPVVTNFVSCESTKETPKDIQQKTTPKMLENNSSTSTEPTNLLNIKSRVNHPTSYANVPLQGWGENDARYRMLLKAPHSLTKLAKALSLGFDPSFSKDYFEPFERRPRPVTLVAFRKNGLAPRRMVKYAMSKSSEIAEMQSPYNEVGSFWQDEQGDT